MSKALTELRADMVNQAQADVKAHSDKASVDYNIQKVIEKHSKELQVDSNFHYSVFKMLQSHKDRAQCIYVTSNG